jgi:hypothetical protein
VLKELPPQQAAARPPALLIWSARHLSELRLLLPQVALAAASAGLALQVQLYYTGGARPHKAMH